MTDETNKPMDDPALPPPAEADAAGLELPPAAEVVESSPIPQEASLAPILPELAPDVPAADAEAVESGQGQSQAEEDGAEEGGAEEDGLEARATFASEETEEEAGVVRNVSAVAKPAPKKSRAKKVKADEVVAETAVEEEEKSTDMQWYILKVQSNREESIREGLQRRVAIAGLGRFFGDAIVPIEKVTEVKGGRKRVIKRKLYPGYLVVQMELNDDTWFLVRETPGIGDFTGAAGRPTPMLPHEVARIVSTQEEKTDAAPKLQIAFSPGDRVKINEGTFENFEGEVETIDTASGRVIVMINIFGRSTPVELEYWQIESL